MLLYLLVGLGALVLIVAILGLLRGWFRPRGAHANFDKGFSATAIAQLAEVPQCASAPHAHRSRPGNDVRAEGCA